MPDIDLTQAEADLLIAIEKHRTDGEERDYPGTGGSITAPLISADKREHFLLDVNRSAINLVKGTYQERARQVLVLVRLDFGGAPHRNPDDTEIPCPHLHLFCEGYGDKWAVSVPSDDFSDLSDAWQTLHDFMTYCNITQPPYIHRGLFI